MSKSPGTARVLRAQDDFVVTDRHPSLRVAETNTRQQRAGWNDICLSPRTAVIVTQKNMASLADSHEPLACHGDIEEQRAGRQTRMLSNLSRFRRLRSGRRGNQGESRGDRMPPRCYRIPLICSTLGW
jgi:hypothetical protein